MSTMMQIRGDDPIIGQLLAGPDEVTYHLIALIRRGDRPLLETDGAHFLAAQSTPRLPLWLWLRSAGWDASRDALLDVLLRRLAQNQALSVNAPEGAERLMREAGERAGLSVRTHMVMNAYACYHLCPSGGTGRPVVPGAEHRTAMAELLRQLARDGEGESISESAAFGFADAMVGSPSLILWEDGGEIVSMAMIADRDEKYARINTVVTRRDKRALGYAGLAAGELSRRILDDGLIPMLYADRSSPASNRTYQRLGYEKQGEIAEFRFGAPVV